MRWLEVLLGSGRHLLAALVVAFLIAPVLPLIPSPWGWWGLAVLAFLALLGLGHVEARLARRSGIDAARRTTVAREGLGVLFRAGNQCLDELRLVALAPHAPRAGVGGFRPGAEVARELRTAAISHEWMKRSEEEVARLLGASFVEQFRAGLAASQEEPDNLPHILQPEWRAVSRRLTWLNDRMDRIDAGTGPSGGVTSAVGSPPSATDHP